jgi:acyl carrier protein
MSETAAIRDFVHDLLRRRGVPGPVGDTDALLTSGLLDSVDVLEIATFLEERWGIDFADRDFDAGHFDTIDGIALVREGGAN